ncbi:mechanosensitive ion channel family protein [Aureimonas jatrophae]|uniref:Small-conductance mechanosensitive channel n=1 Tax=Aureimonas jatrophae TaxID=1166073 RepID=A0A1H0FD88_9HYPH|nr:mechanosensitive ion channel family protein [Aureimonas jatrophae]MBB3950069.1 small-conductance mechanosensitive channel [Aureimonas jatrophae]SDN92667.1 Small-conductance mechanosensitive channel [Aureimonas jatrophae]
MSQAFAQTPAPPAATADPAAVDALAATAPQTVDQAVRVDPAFVLSKIETWVVGFQRLLPNIVVAVLLFAVAFGVAWGVERAFRRWADQHERSNLGAVLGSFVKWIIILFGGLLALTIVIPSLNPGDLIAGLGIGSVAIGFAFKDILQNWLAGLLILIQRPFGVGDQIVVNGYEGTVEWIETRATIIAMYDGRRVIIPNANVYSNAVTVNTARPTRRSQYDVGIGYGDDIDGARRAMLEAIAKVPGLEAEPAPEVLVWDLAGSAVNLRVRWWTQSKRTNVVHVQAAVLEAIKAALDSVGIDMPYPTQVVLFHDQTEETDGVRGEQREGWPRRPGREPPRPVRLVRSPRGGDPSDGPARQGAVDGGGGHP